MSGNSPKNVLSRLIHSDYFDNIWSGEYKLFKPKIDAHVEKCQHEKCKFIRETNDEIQYNIAMNLIVNEINSDDFNEFVGNLQ